MTDLDNLRFYIYAMEPPKEALRDFIKSGGFKGTDINAMWRIKKLTELFGPCGFGWYYKVTRREILQFDVTHQKCLVDIELYVRDPESAEWSMPIFGTGGNDWVAKDSKGNIKVNDELYKMAITDAIGNACKSLGFGATVYWSQDTTKYTVDEEGNFYETVMTEEELKAEKKKAMQEQAKEDGFFGKAETEADAEKINIRKSTQCMKAIQSWIEEDMLINASHEVIAEYAKRFGQMDSWSPGTYIQCYKELRDAGIKLEEVNL